MTYPSSKLLGRHGSNWFYWWWYPTTTWVFGLPIHRWYMELQPLILKIIFALSYCYRLRWKKKMLFFSYFSFEWTWNQVCFWLMIIFCSYNFLVVLLVILKLLNRIVLKLYMWSSKPLVIDLYEIKIYLLLYVIFNIYFMLYLRTTAINDRRATIISLHL